VGIIKTHLKHILKASTSVEAFFIDKIFVMEIKESALFSRKEGMLK
jgi:hypothetical protein